MAYAFIPGFGLTNDMYSNLGQYKNAQRIEIDSKLTWDDSLEHISVQIQEPTILIGYSQGARLAIGETIEYPNNIKGLVVISGNAGIENDTERKLRCDQDIELAKLVLSDTKEFWREFDTKNVFDSQMKFNSRINDEQILVSQLMNLGQGSMPNYNERISEIKIPILFCSGIRDSKYSLIAKTLKKKTAFSHHILFDSDHRLVHHCPEVLANTIEWFANDVVNR